MADNLDCLQSVLSVVKMRFTLLCYATSGYIDSYVESLIAITHLRQIISVEPDQNIAIDSVDRIDYAIFVTDSFSLLEDFFLNWHRSSNFNANCHFFIVYVGSKDMNDIMAVAWHWYSYNVVMFDKYLNFYVPNRFSASNCELTTIRMLPRCNTRDIAMHRLMHENFMNYHGCPVKILPLTYVPYVIDVHRTVKPGIEVEVIELIAKQMNFKTQYLKTSHLTWGHIYKNGTMTLMYKDMLERKADFMIGMVIPADYMTKYFDLSVRFFPNEFRFYTPKAQLLPPWLNMAAVFTLDTWVSLIVSFVVYSIIVFGFQKLQAFKNSKEIKASESLSMNFMNVFRLTIQHTIRMPNVTINRILYMSWMLVAFIFSACYVNTLLSFLLRAISEHQIDSYEDIVKSGFTIAGNSIFKESFSESYGDPYVSHIYRVWNLTELKDAGFVLRQVAYGRNAIMMTNHRRVSYFMREQKSFTKDGIPVMHIMEPSLSLSAAILLQKGHPLKTGIDLYIIRFRESGILSKLDRDSSLGNLKVNVEATYAPLGMEHVLGEIYVYLFGVVLSSILTTLIVSISCLNFAVATNELLVPNTNDEQMADNLACLENVLDASNMHFALLGYATAGYLDTYVERLFSITDVRQVITLENNQKLVLDSNDRIEYAIFVTDRVSLLHGFFEKWHRSSYFNSNCKFFIIYIGVREINDIMAAAWSWYSYYVVMFDKYLNFYVPKKFSAKNCELTTVKMLPRCDKHDIQKMMKLMNQDFMNYHGCPVDILALKYVPYVIDTDSKTKPGIEIDVIELVGKHLNFTTRYVNNSYTTWGDIYKNGTMTLMYKDMLDRKAEIMLGMVIPTEAITIYFDVSVKFLHNKFRFYVPLAQELPPWRNMCAIFTLDTWLILIFAYIKFTIILYIFQKLQLFKNSREIIDNQSVIMNILNSFCLTIHQPIAMPEVTINRILFMSWILVAFIFTSGFENILLSYLVRATTEHQIQTYKDIAESGYTITGNSVAKESFAESYGDPYISYIYQAWDMTALGDATNVMDRVAYDRNVIMMTNHRRISYFMKDEKRFVSKEGIPELYMMPPSFSLSAVMLMQKGHPLKTGIDLLIIRFLGITFTNVVQTTYKPLGIEHVLGMLYIYIIGITISFLVFVAENVFKFHASECFST
ncbi:uncharacterized protein [Atheta coriaria]|uniref:uncharacterized protein n=1 Tax=Dalotia coriaria TaxID=877792 RepID=UPI0031F35C5F